MKKVISTFLLSAALTSSLVACSNSDQCDNNAGQGSGSQKLMSTAGSSDQLTAAGEQLLDANHWMQADPLFAKALGENPQNLKAQFYRALLKPFLITKGLAMRVKPLLRQNGDIARYEARLKEIPDSATKSFLLDGQEDMIGLADVQNLLVEQRQAFSDLRNFLKEHPDLALQINSPEISKKMNSADFIVLRQAIAGIIINYNLVTNYSADGAEKVVHELADSRLTAEQKQRLIESIPTIGKLRKDQGFNEILNLGADFSAAGKWALRYQDRLCANERDVKICITDQNQAQRSLALIDEALKGPIDVAFQISGEEKTAALDLRSFLNKPVEDLRAIAPANYSACGRVSTLRDRSVGGLLPRSDAEEFLPSSVCDR